MVFFQVRYLSSIHHRNLVTLLGYCQESNTQFLVYEYVPNGSVSSHLYGNSLSLIEKLNAINLNSLVTVLWELCSRQCTHHFGLVFPLGAGGKVPGNRLEFRNRLAISIGAAKGKCSAKGHEILALG